MTAAAVRLRPVEYVQLYGPPAKLCRRCGHKPHEHAAGGRLDQLVLRDIASWASWNADTWGEGTWPSVPMIARRVGYSDRSVQYSLRRLESSGFIERVERPGFSSTFRVVRVVEPVDEAAAVVDLAVHKRRRSRRSNTPPLHRRGATVAPELGDLPKPHPPSPPDRGWDEAVGADAPAQAPPQWRRGGAPDPAAAPPPTAVTPAAGPHRRDAGGPAVLRRAGPAQTDPVATLNAASAAEPASPEPIRWSRRVTRLQRCPTCGAGPGDACRNRAGRLRTANHRARRTPPPPRTG